MSHARKMKRGIERATFGRPVRAEPTQRELEQEKAEEYGHRPPKPATNRGANVGGSSLKPLRFTDGRVRNRHNPPVHTRQADGTYRPKV